MMDPVTSDEIVERLKAAVLSVEPQAAFAEKYGGVIARSIPGQPDTQFCGVFAHTGHVSLAFTDGAKLNDPENILEGGGKHRRHIKVADLADVVEKRCEDFLRQARKLRSDLL